MQSPYLRSPVRDILSPKKKAMFAQQTIGIDLCNAEVRFRVSELQRVALWSAVDNTTSVVCNADANISTPVVCKLLS